MGGCSAVHGRWLRHRLLDASTAGPLTPQYMDVPAVRALQHRREGTRSLGNPRTPGFRVYGTFGIIKRLLHGGHYSMQA